jgi:nitrite reductase (NADH) large subunit
MSPHGIVIVGGGIAGQSVCEAIRARDQTTPVTLVCGEPRLPYDRVRLSELLVSGEAPDALALRPAEWYADKRVEVLTGRRVEWCRPEHGLLGLDDGTLVECDRVALATGSQPLMPPLPGIDKAGVHPFRGPADCEAIRAAARDGARRAAVIGGGLLGLEAARGLAAPAARSSRPTSWSSRSASARS